MCFLPGKLNDNVFVTNIFLQIDQWVDDDCTILLHLL